MTANKPHSRSRMNQAAIEGLAFALSQHSVEIRLALRDDDEGRLQLALADMMRDATVLDSAIVSGGEI